MNGNLTDTPWQLLADGIFALAVVAFIALFVVVSQALTRLTCCHYCYRPSFTAATNLDHMCTACDLTAEWLARAAVDTDLEGKNQ